MYKLFTIKSLAKFAVLGSLILSGATYAAKLDLEKDVDIKSKRLAGDLKNKIVSYLDDVVITQGTLTIEADLVQVYSHLENDTKTYVAKGNPASFKQMLEDGTMITLQADEIRYEPSTYIVTISGNALLRQAGSEVTGSKIVYNTQTEQLNAESGSDADENVTTILKPQPKDKK